MSAQVNTVLVVAFKLLSISWPIGELDSICDWNFSLQMTTAEAAASHNNSNNDDDKMPALLSSLP